ncbi:MAG: electron transport complex subunit RsxG [Cellvibrionaceae bacterium]|nr:electron transport complex subunit RsxG [Cellvibrionaceae bacterium]
MNLSQSIRNNALLLGAFALLTAGVLAGTYLLTKDRIAAAERKAAQRALVEIVSSLPQQQDNDMLADTLAIAEEHWPALGLKTDTELYIARHQGQAIAYLIPATATDGYSGDIKLMIGITPAGQLSGVRVLTHKETPGLGDKVDLNKSDWVLSFNGRQLTPANDSSWAVKKDGGDFDQFTGATITPRAVVAQVKRALQSFAQMQSKGQLAGPPSREQEHE